LCECGRYPGGIRLAGNIRETEHGHGGPGMYGRERRFVMMSDPIPEGASAQHQKNRTWYHWPQPASSNGKRNARRAQSFHIGLKFAGGLVTLSRIFLETLQDDRFHILG